MSRNISTGKANLRGFGCTLARGVRGGMRAIIENSAKGRFNGGVIRSLTRAGSSLAIAPDVRTFPRVAPLPINAARGLAAGAARRLAGDSGGTAAMEFALLTTPFVALMVAILQVSLTFFAQQNIESATGSAARVLMTNGAQQAGMTQAQFKALVCSKLPAFMKCSNVYVDVKSTTDFSSANTNTTTLTYDANGNVTNSWNYTPGSTGQITTVKVFYIWQTSKGPLGFDISTMSNANRLLIATSVFKTEPSGS